MLAHKHLGFCWGAHEYPNSLVSLHIPNPGYFIFRSYRGNCLLLLHRPKKWMRQKNILHTWNNISLSVGTLQ